MPKYSVTVEIVQTYELVVSAVDEAGARWVAEETVSQGDVATPNDYNLRATNVEEEQE